MQRACCERCARPQSHCLCPWLPLQPLTHATKIIVLQDPRESLHPLNTARFLPFGLQHCELHAGEHFHQLDEWLADSRYRSAVLFPHAKAKTPTATPEEQKPWQLFVPDGTWRRAKKIMYSHPQLQALPHFCLPKSESPSAYVLRHTQKTNAYSTLEATLAALHGFEPELTLDALLAPLHRLMSDQRQAMGEEVFSQHYGARTVLK